MRKELLQKLVNAMDDQSLVMIVVSSRGVQLSDWKRIVDIRDTYANGNVIMFEGNMEMYLDFDELEIEYNDLDDEYVLMAKDDSTEVNIKVVV